MSHVRVSGPPYVVSSTVAFSLTRYLQGNANWQDLISDPNPPLPKADAAPAPPFDSTERGVVTGYGGDR